MTHATYGPRTKVHPDRFGSKKTLGPNRLIVLHTSEGGEDTGSAEALSGFMGQPGDRLVDPKNPKGSKYGSSYHAVFDTDRVLPAVPYDVVAYSAGGGNAFGIHGCFPGKAGQTREQWLDENSMAMIRQAARWAADVHESEQIPLLRLSVDQVKSGQRGVCDHYDVSRAFKLSDHTDVGPGFPWDVFWSEVTIVLSPPVEKPKPPQGDPIVFIAVPGEEIAHLTRVHFAVHDSGIVRHASGPDVPQGVETRPVHGPEHFNIYARAANHMSGAEIEFLPE